MGDLRGKMAEEKRMTIDELNTLGESEAFTDKEIDDYQTKLGNTEKAFVIDGRLSWNFIPSSFKIFLDVEENTGAKRVYEAIKSGKRTDEKEFESIAETKVAIQKRVKSDQKRYEKYYKVDFLDNSNYDLTLDTTNLSETEVLEQILKSLPPLPHIALKERSRVD